MKTALDGGEVYSTDRFLAALPKQDSQEHSEYILLATQSEKMDKLFPDNDKGQKLGCGVFYTFNSPCLKYCLNDKEEKNVLNFFFKYKGKIDGLVFSSVSGDAKDPKEFTKEAELAFKKLNDIIPLYRCPTKKNSECFKCYSEGVLNKVCK